MIYRESHSDFYVNQGARWSKGEMAQLSFRPLFSRQKQPRAFLVHNGITHFNVYSPKNYTPQGIVRMHRKVYSLTPVCLKKSMKKDSEFLPKIKAFRIQHKKEVCEDFSYKGQNFKDESLGTDDCIY